jgi:twitching motility two-component system response regulator PilG
MDPVIIMVIDDSLTVRKILEASLQRVGLGVSTFPDGLQAMQALTQQTTPIPQLVLMDVGLPKLDGYHVARAFKQRPGLEHTPIIMLSGHTGRLDKMRGRLAGAQGYVTKPFQPAEVIAVIQAQLAGQNGSPIH